MSSHGCHACCGSWEKVERLDVSGTDDAEVAAVEGRDFDDLQSLGYRDDGCVGGAEREVGVGVDQLSHAFVVGEFEIDDDDCLLDDRAKECALDPCAAGAAEQVSHLGDDWGRYQDRAAGQV